MRTFFRGNDRGSAMLAAVVMITLFSLLFLSFVPRIVNLRNLARSYREEVLSAIRKTNAELVKQHDLY